MSNSQKLSQLINNFTQYNTTGAKRFSLALDGNSESGSNAGSNFVLKRFDDAETFLSNAVSINRSTGATAVSDLTVNGNLTVTGIPTAPTATSGTNTTQVATTAFVNTAVADLVASAPAALNTLNELATALGNDANFSTTITNSLSLKAPLASPTFTGTVSGITAAMVGLGNVTNVAQLANTQTLAITGDVTATATALNTGTIAATLATVTQSTGSSFVKITLDTKGRVTGNTAVAQADITGLLGANSLTETMIADGSLLARVAAAETITGGWTFNNAAGINISVMNLSDASLKTTSTILATVTPTTVDTFSSSIYRSATYQVQITSGANYTAATITVIHDGTDVSMNEFGTSVIGSNLGSFDASITTGNLNLVFTAASATSTTVKVVRTAIVV